MWGEAAEPLVPAPPSFPDFVAPSVQAEEAAMAHRVCDNGHALRANRGLDFVHAMQAAPET